MRRFAALLLTAVAAALCACAPAATVEAAITPTIGIADVTPTPSPSPSPAGETPALAEVLLYLPDDAGEGLITKTVEAEDSPAGLLAALVSAGALPDVDYGRYITCSISEQTLLFDGVETSGLFVYLDLSDAFGQAVKQSGDDGERLILQSLANTFITRYSADGFILSIEGTDLQTLNKRYNRPISFDELVQTDAAASAEP